MAAGSNSPVRPGRHAPAAPALIFSLQQEEKRQDRTEAIRKPGLTKISFRIEERGGLRHENGSLNKGKRGARYTHRCLNTTNIRPQRRFFKILSISI